MKKHAMKIVFFQEHNLNKSYFAGEILSLNSDGRTLNKKKKIIPEVIN